MGRSGETQLQVGVKLNSYEPILKVKYFHPLEVEDCGSETQLEEGLKFKLCYWTILKVKNFHPLEVVGRSGETQLQVGGKLNYVMRSS